MKRYGRECTIKNLGEGMVEMTMYVVERIIDEDIQVTNFKLALMRNVAEPQLRDTSYEPNRSVISSPARSRVENNANFFFSDLAEWKTDLEKRLEVAERTLTQ